MLQDTHDIKIYSPAIQQRRVIQNDIGSKIRTASRCNICITDWSSLAEQATIAALLQNHFELSAQDTSDLMDEGRKAVADSNELYGFTRIIKDHFSEDERIRMIEMLWEVAYSDGQLHHFEANLVRRVAGLIYVSDRESGDARKRVLTVLGLNDAPAS
jgi:uncharacterized tellurite resistance protein B-like protein